MDKAVQSLQGPVQLEIQIQLESEMKKLQIRLLNIKNNMNYDIYLPILPT